MGERFEFAWLHQNFDYLYQLVWSIIHKNPYQIIKNNVLEGNQTRKIEEIKDALLNRENSSGNNLININQL